MPKDKKDNPNTDLPAEKTEDLPFVPPDLHYLAERYIVRIPISDKRLNDRWALRLYAEKELSRRLGDEVQLTSLKVKKPHILAKSKAKIQKIEPEARLIVTVKF